MREACERKAKKVNNNKNENGGGQKENSVERSNNWSYDGISNGR